MRKFLKSYSPRSDNVPAPLSHLPALQPKYTVPPVPHPCPHEHIQVMASKEGLLMRPHVRSGGDSYIRIGWGKEVNVVEVDEEDGGKDWSNSVIIYGIVGVLQLTTASYILLITSRTETGYLLNPTHAVYGIKTVTPIPLIYDRALIALNTLASGRQARPSLIQSRGTIDGSFGSITSESESEEEGEATPVPGRVTFAPSDVPSPSRSPVSIASTAASEDSMTTSPIAKTLASRLSFWTRLSKRTSAETDLQQQPVDVEADVPLAHAHPIPTPIATPAPPRLSLDSILSAPRASPADIISSILAATAPPPATPEERTSELEDKIVRECVREYAKGGMYFAYSFDITRSLQHKQAQIAKSHKQNALLASLNALPETPTTPRPYTKRHRSRSDVPTSPNAPMSPSPSAHQDVDPLAEPYPTLPLWRRVDRQFWWNEWLSKPFIDAGLHSYVLPIMQGHYQITRIPIPREPVLHEVGSVAVADYIVISRRSRERAGLRYQRRGVDEDACVANWVESESVMRVEREGGVNVFSYVQVRGSIPLYWTQTGYSLKPPPLLSPERTHVQNLDALKRHFERTVPLYGPHTIVNLAEHQGKEAAITGAYRDCVGELASKDVLYNEYDFHTQTKGMKYENITKLVENMQRTFEGQGYLWISNNSIMSEQKGVFRVNCIDCLDRTNVVQSAFARHVLNRQLGAVALLNPSEAGRTETDVIFNDVWANNGDAISRAYAGTSALKGDFTRTGKRDLGGLLNDGVNSLARMYTSTFSDWFCQAVIDFMLGYRTLSVFSEFLLKLQSTDPRELIRLSKIRAEAIVTCVSRVLPEGERLLSGWTLFAPEQLDTKMGEKFEEKVILLTAQALYIISYDYTLDKIKIYTRVPLGDIVSITKGAYILSPLEEASRDPMQNAGFVVKWINTNQTTRVTSYSLRNSLDLSSPPASPAPTKSSFSARPLIRASSSFIRRSIDSATQQQPASPPPLTSRTLPSSAKKGPVLSKILSDATAGAGGPTTYAAFKTLPVDPTRARRGSDYSEPADDLTGAATCKEAVDIMVDAIRRACEDLGNVHPDIVTDGDVVSLLDAQKMTSVYAKMEYGVKRLLWLGG